MNIAKQNKSVINLKAVLAMTAMLLTQGGLAQERGTPLFSDNFDTYMTFAENWIPRPAVESVVSKNGKILVPKWGSLRMTRETPEEFYAELDVTLSRDNTDTDLQKNSAAFGFNVGKHCFYMKGNGSIHILGPRVGGGGRRVLFLTWRASASGAPCTWRWRAKWMAAGRGTVSC